MTCDPPATGSPEGGSTATRVPVQQEEWKSWAETIQDKIDLLMDILVARDRGPVA